MHCDKSAREHAYDVDACAAVLAQAIGALSRTLPFLHASSARARSAMHLACTHAHTQLYVSALHACCTLCAHARTLPFLHASLIGMETRACTSIIVCGRIAGEFGACLKTHIFSTPSRCALHYYSCAAGLQQFSRPQPCPTTGDQHVHAAARQGVHGHPGGSGQQATPTPTQAQASNNIFCYLPFCLCAQPEDEPEEEEEDPKYVASKSQRNNTCVSSLLTHTA